MVASLVHSNLQKKQQKNISLSHVVVACALGGIMGAREVIMCASEIPPPPKLLCPVKGYMAERCNACLRHMYVAATHLNKQLNLNFKIYLF